MSVASKIPSYLTCCTHQHLVIHSTFLWNKYLEVINNLLYTVVLKNRVTPVQFVNMNSSLDYFHLQRAFLFETQLVDMTPRHKFPRLPLPLTPPSFPSSSTLTHRHFSFPCPCPHLLATALRPPLPVENSAKVSQRKRQTSETLSEKIESRRVCRSALSTSLLLQCGCVLAGDGGSRWTSGLWLGLRERGLLLPDSAVESEPEESELECLTRLPWVCARCADRLSVNTHTNIG